MLPPNLRPSDLVTFLAVMRTGSISGAARAQGVTPSQVSKAVGRLEEELGAPLLRRAGRGITASEMGQRMVPHLQDLVARMSRLGAMVAEAAPLTIVSPSALTDPLLPVLAEALPERRLCGLQMPPSLIHQHLTDGLFEVVVLDEPLPPPWVSREVGQLRKGLFASPALAHKLGKKPVHPDRLRKVPFVSPVHNVERTFVAISDDCPLGKDERTVGHQAQTLGLALELAALTDQLVFGPVLGARRYLQRKLLVEVPVVGWHVTQTLYLSCDPDRVQAQEQRAMLAAVKTAL